MATAIKPLPQSAVGDGATFVIVGAVGTYQHGFDSLVQAFDQACEALDIDGFAQIGHSKWQPRYVAFERFLAHGDLMTMLRHAQVVVSHAGMGMIGDAMRCGAEIIMVPRRAKLTASEPTNDQLPFARAVAQHYGLNLCENVEDLRSMVERFLNKPFSRRDYGLESNVNQLLAQGLANSTKRTIARSHELRQN